MSLDDYKVVLYRNEPSGWVAEAPSIPGCHALMPTRDAALTELAAVFQMISDEYAERSQTLPADTNEIIHAWRQGI
jgi:predicted RNase H-like HicB family nuclease